MSDPRRLVTHEWVRDRLGPWAAGVLSEDDRQALEFHLASCAECRRPAEELTRVDPDEEHIPPSLLARWDRTAPTLTGELRTLVQRHLEHCEDCRRELVTLGYDPDLIRQSRLEPVPGPTPARQRSRLRWSWWYAAGAGALATAASIAIVSQTALMQDATRTAPDRTARSPAEPPVAGVTPPARPPDQTSPPPTASAPARPDAGGSVALMALGPWRSDAVSLGETLRQGSGEPPITVVSFDSTRHEIAIEPPRSLAVADGDRFELEIVDGEGVTRRSLKTTMRRVFPEGTRRVIVVRRGEPPLPPGRYELRIRVSGADGTSSELSSHAFEIRP